MKEYAEQRSPGRTQEEEAEFDVHDDLPGGTGRETEGGTEGKGGVMGRAALGARQVGQHAMLIYGTV